MNEAMRMRKVIYTRWVRSLIKYHNTPVKTLCENPGDRCNGVALAAGRGELQVKLGTMPAQPTKMRR